MAADFTIRVVDGGTQKQPPATGAPQAATTAPGVPATGVAFPTVPTGKPVVEKREAETSPDRAGAAAGRQLGGKIGGLIPGGGQLGAKAGGALGGALPGVAAVAGPIGIAVAAITVMGLAVKKFTDVMVQEADRLAGLSGDVAAAVAETDVRRLQATQRRAQDIGPQVAQFERRRADVEIALFDLQTQSLAVLLKLAEKADPLIEFTITAVDTLADILEALSKNEKGINLLAGLIPLVRIVEAFADDQKDKDFETEDLFTRQFLGLFADRALAGELPGAVAGRPRVAPALPGV